MENSEDLPDHFLSQDSDMYDEKNVLPNFNLGMDDYLADFSESSVVTKLPVRA